MPQVSVVLPVWNGAHVIERAINSLLNQTYSDFELIVVNDGSTDRTTDVVEAIRDSRIRAVRQPHTGVWQAMNRGLDEATGTVISRMDADDVCHPTRLEKQLQLLNTGYDVVGSCVRILTKTNGQFVPVPSLQRYANWINRETLSPEAILALRFVEFPLVNPTLMAHRSYWDLRCTDDDFPEDYDLMLRGAAAGMKFAKVNEPLLDWIDSAQRLTRNHPRYTPDAFMQCRRSRFLEGPLAGVRRVDLWGAGQTGKPWLLWLQANGLEVRTVYDVNPRKTGHLIHNVPVQGPNNMPTADGTLLVIAVGAAGARPLIREHILKHGYTLGQDAWFVA